MSIAAHALVLGFVVYISTRPPPIQETFAEVTFFAASPPPPPPPPPPKRRTNSVKTVKPTEQIIQPKEIPREKPKETPKPQQEESSASSDEGDDDGVEGGVEGGVKGGVLGGTLGGVIGGIIGGTGTEVVPFGEGMTAPALTADLRSDIQRAVYTREAREAQIQGVVIVRCNIFADGRVGGCTVLKALPFIAEPLVKFLNTIKVKPATYQGRPVSISYVFNFKFEAPK